MCFCLYTIPHATVISGGQVGSGPMCSVLVLVVFGLTTFIVLAENQILALVHTEAGVFIRVVTQKMSRYCALQLRLKLYPVRTSMVQTASECILYVQIWRLFYQSIPLVEKDCLFLKFKILLSISYLYITNIESTGCWVAWKYPLYSLTCCVFSGVYVFCVI